MPWKIGGPYARRCLRPQALHGVLRGVVPAELARDLNLPPDSSFETLDPDWVNLADRSEDRRLLDHLTESLDRAITSREVNFSAFAFPGGLPLVIDMDRLPLHTRTRNCLKKEGLYSAEALRRVSLKELLAVPAFGVKCLVDLLTAVNGRTGRDAVIAYPIAPSRASVQEGGVSVNVVAKVTELFGATTLSARLTREARLLGCEPWSKQVSLYDVRLGSGLLRDETTFKDVQVALASGRFALEHQFCPERPRCDIDLLRCPLLSRTRKCLSDAGLTKLSALSSRTLRELLELVDGLGERSLVDLLALLDVCQLLTAKTAPVDREPTLADFCEAVVNRSRDCWFPERLADRIHRTRAQGIRCLSLPLEEELREVAVSTLPHLADAVIEYLGWDGRGPRTLEIVGNAKGLTRERVRQKVSKLTDRLSEVSAWAPVLIHALDVCEQACPLPTEEIAALLQQNGLARAPFHAHGLLTASEFLRLTHRLSLRRFEGADWFFKAGQDAILRKCMQISRSIIKRCGVCSLGDLQAEIGEQTSEVISEETLRSWLLRLSSVQWLDRDRLWFRLPTDGSSLETKLWKIFAVAPEIHLGELRQGLMRHYRSAAAPPSAVLLQLCQHLGLETDGDIVRTRKELQPEGVLTEVEYTFYYILKLEGPLFQSVELEKRCLHYGMNVHTFWMYLMFSPILAQYAAGIYGLRGARFAPGEAESAPLSAWASTDRGGLRLEEERISMDRLQNHGGCDALRRCRCTSGHTRRPWRGFLATRDLGRDAGW